MRQGEERYGERMTLTLLTAARGISSLGDGLHYIAMAWLVMSSTGLALSASVLVVARALPGAIFTLFAGGAADALDRRRLLCWIWAGQALATACVPVLCWVGGFSLWQVFLVDSLLATLGVFGESAWVAIIPQYFGSDRLLRANSSFATASALGFMLGAAVAGPVVRAVGITNALLLDAVSYLAPTCALLLLRPASQAATQQAGLSPQKASLRQILHDVGAGLRYTVSDRLLLNLALLLLLPMITVSPIMAMEPTVAGGGHGGQLRLRCGHLRQPRNLHHAVPAPCRARGARPRVQHERVPWAAGAAPLGAGGRCHR